MLISPKDLVLEFGFLPGQKIADIGAGTGHFALALARVLGGDSRIYAVDIQESPLIRLKKAAVEEGLRNLEVVQGDAESPHGTKLRTDLVDGAVVSNTLFQMEKKEAALAEIDRILKRKGRVVVIDSPSKIERENMKKLFEGRGFNFERGFDAGEHHYVLIFKK